MKKRRSAAVCLALMLALGVGCSSGGPREGGGGKREKEAHRAPHGGTLFAEPNHKYHLEVKGATIYLLDRSGEDPAATEAKQLVLTIKGDPPAKVEFRADPQKGDPAGKSSRFTAPADRLPEKIDYTRVEISGEIDGKMYHFKPDRH